MTIQATALVGKPWQWGGRGDPGWDCFGVMVEYFRLDGIELPDVQRPPGAMVGQAYMDYLDKFEQLWVRVQRPYRRRDVVLLWLPREEQFHVGVIDDDNGFWLLQATKSLGVIRHRLSSLKLPIVSVFRYREPACCE
ncbi:MAG TPA: NlpC/P60 family protein [Candidatus Binatia bacterium]|nr:NlpC/P60 family protein [Candidatus Binatia bacterium]